MITWYSLRSEPSVSRSKPRAIFPKEISYCLRKIMALLQSTISVYCIFLLVFARAVLQHLDLLADTLSVFPSAGSKAPWGSRLEQLQSRP